MFLEFWRDVGENDVIGLKRIKYFKRRELFIRYRIKVKEEKNRKCLLNLRIEVIGYLCGNNFSRFLWFIVEWMDSEKMEREIIDDFFGIID